MSENSSEKKKRNSNNNVKAYIAYQSHLKPQQIVSFRLPSEKLPYKVNEVLTRETVVIAVVSHNFLPIVL